jgi:hypothetical protein
LRKTYGWRQKQDWVSISQFGQGTGLRKQHLWRTQVRLIQRKIVTKNGYKISFNKDHSQWQPVTKSGYVTKNGYAVTKIGCEFVTKIGGHKRNYTKETNTKEIYIVRFDLFWAVWPKKEDKKKAKKAFLRIKPSDQLLQKMLEAIKQQKETKKWQEGYIPLPTTWLNGERWNDEVENEKQKWW